MRTIVVFASLLLPACAGLGDVPSLAPRPIEKSAAAPLPVPAPPTPVAADPALVQQIAGLMAEVRSGDALFQTEDRAGAAAIAAGRRASEGSDAWIAGETARSALEAARQRSSDALTALDQLLVERTGANGGGLAEIGAAKSEAETIVARQTERLRALTL